MRAKILVVDDDKELCKALQIRLHSMGHRVIFAFDGMQGLMYAVRERPDLIILDIIMPGGDGISVAEKLKQNVHTCSIPVIVFTGTKPEEVIMKCDQIGIQYFVMKPDTERLLKYVKEILGGKS